MNASDPMPFTGERFTPECEREIWYEHWHRYVFARALTRGKRVLEIGVGAGTDFLNWIRNGAIATGVDLTEAAIRLTRERMELNGVDPSTYHLQQADAEKLP